MFQGSRPRLVLWPRGLALFGLDLNAFGVRVMLPDSPILALRCLLYHTFHRRTRLVAWPEWRRLASAKMGLSPEAAFLMFSQAQCVAPLPPRQSRRLTHLDVEDGLGASEGTSADCRVDLLGLVIVIAFAGFMQSDSSPGSTSPRESARDLVFYIKDHLRRLRYLFFAFWLGHIIHTYYMLIL